MRRFHNHEECPYKGLENVKALVDNLREDLRLKLYCAEQEVRHTEPGGCCPQIRVSSTGVGQVWGVRIQNMRSVGLFINLHLFRNTRRPR